MATDRKIFAIGEDGLRNVAQTLSQEPPGGGTGLEARVAKLEATVEHIREDVGEIKGDIRKLLYALIGGFLLLAGIVIGSHLRLADKIDRIAPPPPVQVPAKK